MYVMISDLAGLTSSISDNAESGQMNRFFIGSMEAINSMKQTILLLVSLFMLIPVVDAQQVAVDREQLMRDLKILSSDALEGRRTGTAGNKMAAAFIEHRFETLGLLPFGDGYRHRFDHTNPRTGELFSEAVNLIGQIEGSHNPDRYIVLTAHYDHLGIMNGEIYNGADDNASGIGGLLAAAAWFRDHQPENSMLFIAFDAEEQGLGGAKYFVTNPVVPLEKMVLNVNLDMISHNFENELYLAGTWHYEFLKPLAESAKSDSHIEIHFGHDSPDLPPGDDWTLSSDHGPFHENGIPFLYFGVEDHPFYHNPGDTFDSVNQDFYLAAVTDIITILQHLDSRLDEVHEQSGR